MRILKKDVSGRYQFNQKQIAEFTDKNVAKKQAQQSFEASLPLYLSNNGWTELGKDLWSKPNWEISGGDCVRSLKQAYKIQLKLSKKESEKNESLAA